MNPSYTPNCGRRCNFSPAKIGQDKADAMAAAYEGPGSNLAEFTRKVTDILGYEPASTTLRRHAKEDYREVVAAPEAGAQDATAPPAKVNTMDVLDTIIAAGFKNSRHWKPTIKDTMDAMAMKQRLGGDDPFKDMFAMLDAWQDGFDSPEAREAHEARVALGLPPEDGYEDDPATLSDQGEDDEEIAS
jgi:hypothetical protein